MKNRDLRRPLAGVALVALSAIVLSVQLSSTAAAGREYFFSTDAEVQVVSLISSGGMRQGKGSLIVFGDGRVVYRPRHPNEPLKEARATYTEVDEIVRALVDGGIMDWDRADVSRRLRDAGAATDWIDIGTLTIVVNLDRYRNGDVEISPFHKEISVSWLPALIKRFSPDAQIPEVDAIAFVQSRIWELLGDAEE